MHAIALRARARLFVTKEFFAFACKQILVCVCVSVFVCVTGSVLRD